MLSEGRTHGTLRLRVYEHLRDNILLGKYLKGSALTEVKVAEKLGVSRTPVREAFRQLELDGLVEATPNKGVVVGGFENDDIYDMFDVRLRIEPLTAAKSAHKISKTALQKLRRLLEQEYDYLANKDTQELLRTDALFHETIYLSSGSKIMQNILGSINIYTQQARYISLATKDRGELSIFEHEQILKAMEARNAILAENNMRTHIENAYANYKNYMALTGGFR